MTKPVERTGAAAVIARVIEEKNDRIAELEAALQKARPYVAQFADNCPSDDGGAEAVADLKAVDAALQAR